MLAKKDTFVRKDATGGRGGLCAYTKPIKCTFAVDNDACRVGVGVVSAELLDVTTVAGCAGVGYHDVVKC